MPALSVDDNGRPILRRSGTVSGPASTAIAVLPCFPAISVDDYGRRLRITRRLRFGLGSSLRYARTRRRDKGESSQPACNAMLACASKRSIAGRSSTVIVARNRIPTAERQRSGNGGRVRATITDYEERLSTMSRRSPATAGAKADRCPLASPLSLTDLTGPSHSCSCCVHTMHGA